jgi:hypothetical protein
LFIKKTCKNPPIHPPTQPPTDLVVAGEAVVGFGGALVEIDARTRRRRPREPGATAVGAVAAVADAVRAAGAAAKTQVVSCEGSELDLPLRAEPLVVDLRGRCCCFEIIVFVAVRRAEHVPSDRVGGTSCQRWGRVVEYRIGDFGSACIRGVAAQKTVSVPDVIS